ncbi:family of serine hydrolases 3 [Corynascus novoguineensis]|uniref:Family of serine hydrolases 3 n=1 Tax=Corynascus novoguineensis TaxID=1126955 RepID=A0AAN7HRF1_9PEZI|nr:family of serine hydrolases 3 [Corynascus novoguineensis]
MPQRIRGVPRLFPVAPTHSAIRYDLGDSHTYEFVEGTIPVPMAPEFASFVTTSTNTNASKDDDDDDDDGKGNGSNFFAYADFSDLPSCLAALDQLDAYLAAEGPFDGLLAFSQGATIAATYLAHRARCRAGKKDRKEPLPFKCAVFFSAGGVFDVDRLAAGEVKLLTPEEVGEPIDIPTAHIWGRRDDTPVHCDAVEAVCAAETRQAFVHEGSHEIPGVRSPADVKSSVRVMRRVISMAA